MPPSFTVRPSQPLDIEWIATWEENPKTARWLGEVGPAWHGRAWGDPDQEHLIAALDGRDVGFAVLAGCTTQPRTVEIRRLAVHPRFRGAGLGRALLRSVTSRAVDHHLATSMWLDVKVANRRARSLYELEGFEVSRIETQAVAEPDGTRSDLMIMERSAHRLLPPTR